MEEVPASPISDISIIDMAEILTSPTPATPIIDMVVVTTGPASNCEPDPIHSNLPDPGPGTSGRFFREDERKTSITFYIAPNPNKPLVFKSQEWLGSLEVKCQDVPRLMRDGFHWDISNVIKEEGYVEHHVTSRITREYRLHRRWYFLTDTHQPQRWIASLSIEALHQEVLDTIRLSQVSRERIKYTRACNQDGKVIYEYAAQDSKKLPMLACNAIYDDMPMEGFWPWPPRENDPPVDCDDEDENERAVYKSSEERMSQDNSGSAGNVRDEREGRNSKKLWRAYNTALDCFCTICCTKLDNDYEQLNTS
ncbi:hypothetical protein F4678DRAFT_435865 [Xylaria arbuscula]|nr:hypothetical protein F4678DRAFT_435865 [Xylaria arbuscula]